MSKKRIFGVLLLAILAGCVGNVPVKAPSISTDPFPKNGPPLYELQAGDTVAVKFWGYTELDEEQRIRPDGKISLPFVDEVQAAGLTPAELDTELTRRYENELASPQITVIVREAAGQQVYVGGKVAAPGTVPMTPKLTLFQALQSAGGLAQQSRFSQVLLIRTFSDGSRMARTLDLRAIMSGRNPGVDVLLQPFDVIYVPARRIEGFQTFAAEYVQPIYDLLPVRIIGTIDLFPDDKSLFE